ncbi:hypothetical protein PENTCL1PPCAC_566, partial [Pristionchus entomophagus]
LVTFIIFTIFSLCLILSGWSVFSTRRPTQKLVLTTPINSQWISTSNRTARFPTNSFKKATMLMMRNPVRKQSRAISHNPRGAERLGNGSRTFSNCCVHHFPVGSSV